MAAFTRNILFIGTVALAMPVFGLNLKKLAPELHRRTSNSVDVVIQYHRPPASSPASLRSLLGAVVKTSFSRVGGVLATVSRTQLDAISDDPNVRYVTPNRRVSAAADPVVLDH